MCEDHGDGFCDDVRGLTDLMSGAGLGTCGGAERFPGGLLWTWGTGVAASFLELLLYCVAVFFPAFLVKSIIDGHFLFDMRFLGLNATDVFWGAFQGRISD